MNSKKIRTAGALILALLVLLYVGYQFYKAGHRGIQTETAMYGQVSDVVQTQGFVIRKEEPIGQAPSGVLSYRVADGSRVSKGGVIADVFATEEDAAAQREMERLDREIENLRGLSQSANFYVANPSMLGDQIYAALEEIALGVNENSFSDLSQRKEDLQNALTRRRLVTGEEDAASFTQRADELQAQRDQLAGQAGSSIGTVEAPAAGYFISQLDGLESAVDTSQVEDLTVEQVKDLLAKPVEADSSGGVGKVCQDFNWYVACVFDEDDMVHMEDVQEVTLNIPSASTEEIPAQVLAQNYDPDTGETAVVFQCSYMDSDIASVRNAAVEVTVATYSGVLVNERALRFEDVEVTATGEDGAPVTQVQENVKGVYVLYGGQLEFVQVFSDHTVNGYAICKTNLSAQEEELLVTQSTIQLYDQVVIEGTDLYDGKIVH